MVYKVLSLGMYKKLTAFEKCFLSFPGKEWETLPCPQGGCGQKSWSGHSYFAGNDVKESVGKAYRELRRFI